MKSTLAYIASIVAVAVVVAFAQPVPTAPQTTEALRRIDRIPDGGRLISAPNTLLADTEIQPVTTGNQGRGITLCNASKSTVWNTVFAPGSDDSLGIRGDCRGTLVAHCIFQCEYTATGWTKSLIGYTNPDASNQPGPIYGAADGYAGTFYRCEFQGQVRLLGGVWQFVGCKFRANAFGAMEAMDAKINLIDCDFRTVPKPDSATRWYRDTGPCLVRVTGLVNGAQSPKTKTRLYFSNCRLNGQPIDGPALCRRFNPQTGYDGPGSVASAVFLKTPN